MKHLLEHNEFNLSKDCLLYTENTVWSRVMFCLPALSLITLSHTCKELRLLIKDNLVAWCFDLEFHPDFSISANTILGTRAILYQLYELYRRNFIGEGLYNSAKQKFFPDETLIEKASLMFVVPKNRKPLQVDMGGKRVQVPWGGSGIQISTVYGMTVMFVSNFDAATGRRIKNILSFDGNFDNYDTYGFTDEDNIWYTSLKTTSIDFACELVTRGNARQDPLFIEEFEDLEIPCEVIMEIYRRESAEDIPERFMLGRHQLTYNFNKVCHLEDNWRLPVSDYQALSPEVFPENFAIFAAQLLCCRNVPINELRAIFHNYITPPASPKYPKLLEYLQTIRPWKQQDKIRFKDISRFTDELLERLNKELQ